MGKLSQRVGDRLLLLTTHQAAGGRWPAPIPGEGWRLRRAGPRWFAVWSSDCERLRRLRVLLLPAAWLGLSAQQELALALGQSRAGDCPAALAGPLLTARGKLRRRLSRGF
ncbi:hypothetical protein SAMN04488021_11449 [Paracoccus aminovorans]|uniref:Uncharacterized protein n=1 Tax=Paracoccus aminovorans TaxID=34004 RepID=A0A1I3AFX5_9RHOB|nr:hypothetical protein [Paracoccus aminovorans]CQR84186.1 hypothetical protein JCM7685_pAMV3p0241 [Paracoccus aminovorans]SFH48241.1 hypothetical protein SAMN04488021_11449 [Paracoccus aminovorans]